MAELSKTSAAQQIGEDHLHLRDLLMRIRKTLSAPNADRERIARLMEGLLAQVRQHFEYEEYGGYFREAIELAPRLTARAESLLGQHGELARRLMALQQLALQQHAAGDSSDRLWRQQLIQEFAEFHERFAAHEAAENGLLVEAYCSDIGDKD